MKNLIAALACVAAMARCGSDGGEAMGGPGVDGGTTKTATHDNVAACKAWEQNAKCGAVDVGTSFNCSAYASLTCDISAYFDCLSTKYVCVNGQWDTSKLATAGDCASKATCK